MTRGILLIAVVAVLGSCAAGPEAVEMPINLPGAGPDGLDLSYLAVHPRPDDGGNPPWPMLVFLHGRGETAGDLSRVKIHGPIRATTEMRDRPFLIVAPHLPVTVNWRPEWVMAVVDDARRRWPIDPNRIYLTGLSLGGHGTWATAIEHPDYFAAIAPVSGRGDPEHGCKLVALPVWAFHGVLDTVVEASGSHLMVDAIRQCGGSPGLTLYPDVGHDAWTQTYNDQRLYEWLLSHSRRRN